MTSNQIRMLTAGFSMAIEGSAWGAIGRLSSVAFISVRDQLLARAAEALDAPGVFTGGDEVEKQMTARIDDYTVAFRVDFSRRLVVLLGIEKA